MDWLPINHQTLGDKTSTNLRKGYRVGDLTKNKDPDKSNTPLLHDQTPSLEKDTDEDLWERENTRTKSPNKRSLEIPADNDVGNDEWSDAGAPSPRRGCGIKTPTKTKRGGSGRSPLLSRDWKGQESERLLIDFRDETGAIGGNDEDAWVPDWQEPKWDTPTKGYHRISSKRY